MNNTRPTNYFDGFSLKQNIGLVRGVRYMTDENRFKCREPASRAVELRQRRLGHLSHKTNFSKIHTHLVYLGDSEIFGK